MRYMKTVQAITLAGLLAWNHAVADNGYRLDYDYPNQGDDWYGGFNAPDPRRDYPALDVDQAWNGDDFGMGYERMMDPFGFGPPLELFVDRHSAYEFRYGNLAFYGYDCWLDDDCGSGSWCVSAPTCQLSRCQPGSNRNCSDTNPCTADGCNSLQQICVHSTLPPIGEATGLMLSRVPGSSMATLTWDDRPDEDYYNVYRGEDSWLGDLTCFGSPVTGTTLDDDGTVAPGGVYFHLVTAEDQCGESSLGNDSVGTERLNLAICP